MIFILQTMLAFVAALTLVPYLCRIHHVMGWRTTKRLAIVVHLCGALAALWVCWQAASGAANGWDVAVLGMSLGFICYTWPTWRGGVIPMTQRTHLTQMEEADLKHVHGGRQ